MIADDQMRLLLRDIRAWMDSHWCCYCDICDDLRARVDAARSAPVAPSEPVADPLCKHGQWRDAHCPVCEYLKDAAPPSPTAPGAERILSLAKELSDKITYDDVGDTVGDHACCGTRSYKPHDAGCPAMELIALAERLANGGGK